jgi:hypothetical protein
MKRNSIFAFLAIFFAATCVVSAQVQTDIDKIEYDEGQTVLYNFTVLFEANMFHPHGKKVQVVLTKNDLPRWSKVVHKLCISEYMMAFLCVALRDKVEEVSAIACER